MKKITATILTMALLLCLLAGCGSASKSTADIRIASLKGPTSIGLLKLKDDAANEKAANNYTFEMAVTADEILPKIISGEVDIALIPANVAAILYNKTEKGVEVLDINTLGVLYAVSGDDTIDTIASLKGKTVYITNKGTTPDLVTQFLLKANNVAIEDVNVEYKSEAAEVAALLAEDPNAVGILPQPFVTSCCIQNENLKPVLNLTQEWSKCSPDGSALLTGVTVASKNFINSNKQAVDAFLDEHKASSEFVNSNVETAAQWVVNEDIIPKAPIAVKAIPACNITYMDGDEMKTALSGYLNILYELDPSVVGGKLPEDDFYYKK